MTATWRLVVPWMRVSAQRCSPVIEVGLSLVQSFEAQTFQQSFLRVTDAGFDFALRSGS
jgi:hypothetical protein